MWNLKNLEIDVFDGRERFFYGELDVVDFFA